MYDVKQEISSLISKAWEEERKRIKAEIIYFAIDGKFDAPEMKGLQLYTKIMNYFDSFLNTSKGDKGK